MKLVKRTTVTEVFGDAEAPSVVETETTERSASHSTPSSRRAAALGEIPHAVARGDSSAEPETDADEDETEGAAGNNIALRCRRA